MRESGKTGYCVTCLKCGKIHQREYAVDAMFICPKCGYENYVYLKHGVQIEMPAAQLLIIAGVYSTVLSCRIAEFHSDGT